MTIDRKPVLGLVGGIGSGKSAAAAALAKHGGQIVAGDPIGHDALRQSEIKRQIAQRWPAAIGPDEQVDRRKLGRIVFADPVELRELETIVFPWIKKRLREEIALAQSNPSVRYVILDAAVMLEAGWTDVCDKLIFVDAPRGLRVTRVAKRGWTGEDLDRREKSQMTLEEKRSLADAVLVNDSGFDKLQRNADQLLNRWGLLNQQI